MNTSQAREAAQDEAQEPQFSVIVAVYNAEPFLKETLLSLQAQTFRAMEVIMVDDGSTDRSSEIARNFCDRDARFHLIQTGNRGISAARNLAAAQARAPWIAVCDADDTWEPDKLDVQARFIASWEAAQTEPLIAIGTSGDQINREGRFIRTLIPRPRPWPEALQEEGAYDVNMINSSVVFRRSTFEMVGGYRADYTPTEDTDLWVRFSEHGAVLNLPDHLTHYRMHGGNISEKDYVVMILQVHRIRANAARRASQQPEYTNKSFTAQLRLDSRGYAETMRDLRQMMYYNKSKNGWSNRDYPRSLAALLMAVLVSPLQTLRLLSRSKVLHSGRTLLRRRPK